MLGYLGARAGVQGAQVSALSRLSPSNEADDERRTRDVTATLLRLITRRMHVQEARISHLYLTYDSLNRLGWLTRSLVAKT